MKATLQGSSVVTTQGQVTIPKAVRNRFGIEAGDIVEFLVTETGLIVMRKLETRREVDI